MLVVLSFVASLLPHSFAAPLYAKTAEKNSSHSDLSYPPITPTSSGSSDNGGDDQSQHHGASDSSGSSDNQHHGASDSSGSSDNQHHGAGGNSKQHHEHHEHSSDGNGISDNDNIDSSYSSDDEDNSAIVEINTQ
jgi:hypothetical protein